MVTRHLAHGSRKRFEGKVRCCGNGDDVENGTSQEFFEVHL